jgi:hypothetical protein
MSNIQDLEKILHLIPYSGSAASFVELVAHSNENKQKLFKDIREFNIWRMFMGVFGIEKDLQGKLV